MSLRRTQAVTLKSGKTVNVLPREIPGLKAAGLLSKDTKAQKKAKVTPRNDAKTAAAKKLIADRIAEQEAKQEKQQKQLIDKVYEALNNRDHDKGVKLADGIIDKKAKATALDDADQVKAIVEKEAAEKEEKEKGETKEEKDPGGTKDADISKASINK